MNFMKFVVIAVACAGSLAVAHDVVPELDASTIDVSKWCVYNSALYSRGSVIDVKGRSYVCRQESEAGPGANRLAWARLD